MLIDMTRSLAREVGDYSIGVNAMAPGLLEHGGQNAPKALTELQLKERSDQAATDAGGFAGHAGVSRLCR